MTSNAKIRFRVSLPGFEEERALVYVSEDGRSMYFEQDDPGVPSLVFDAESGGWRTQSMNIRVELLDVDPA